MYRYPLFCAPQPPAPSPPTALPGPLLVYQIPPPVNLGTYHYNTDWSPAHQQAFLSNLNQMNSGQPSSSEPPANNDGYQCRWIVVDAPCNQAFADFDGLMVHLGAVHDVQGNAARNLTCRWLACGKKYRRHAFRRHIEVHLGSSVSCPECGKPYSRTDSMRAHLKKKHGE